MSKGFFDSLKNKLTGAEAVDDMCNYLKSIGVNACVLPKDSLEAIPIDKVFGFTSGNPPLGTIKVEGMNIELVELYPKTSGKSSSMSLGVGNVGVSLSASDDEMIFKRYIIRTDTRLGKELKAELKPIEKGLVNKEVVGYEWKGGRLAKALEADSTLLQMISEAYAKAIIFVDFNDKHRYVAISGQNVRKSKKSISFNLGNLSVNPVGAAKVASSVAKGQDVFVWKNYFPTAEEFAVYDRIALNVKNLTTAVQRGK